MLLLLSSSFSLILPGNLAFVRLLMFPAMATAGNLVQDLSNSALTVAKPKYHSEFILFLTKLLSGSLHGTYRL